MPKVNKIYSDDFKLKLEQMALEDTYFEKCLSFVEDIWNLPLEFLTKKQIEWLESIYEQVGE